MFASSRLRALDSTIWTPEEIMYIEAFKTSLGDDYRQGKIPDADIPDWIARGRPQPSDIKGGIRLILCSRKAWGGADGAVTIMLSRASYEAIESGFHLHPATMASLRNFQGVCSSFSRQSPQKLSIIVKAHQKSQLSNHGLSLSFDQSTRITTALLCSSHLMKASMADKTGLGPHSALIEGLIKTSTNLWCQPLALPLFVLSDYTVRQQRHVNIKHQEVVQIERQLGVTKIGQLRSVEGGLVDSLAQEQQSRDSQTSIRQLTKDLSTIVTDTIYFVNSCDWTVNCASFLESLREDLGDEDHVSSLEIKENLAHLTFEIHSLAAFFAALKSRAELQLSTLYSFIAQKDNLATARLSAAAGRDSSAMKVLAFITAFFLPGTFVATLFSMSMFDWQASDNDSTPKTLSDKFWIFWAVSVPLTILVVISWWIWFRVEQQAYNDDVGQAVDSVDRPNWTKDVKPSLFKARLGPTMHMPVASKLGLFDKFLPERWLRGRGKTFKEGGIVDA